MPRESSRPNGQRAAIKVSARNKPARDANGKWIDGFVDAWHLSEPFRKELEELLPVLRPTGGHSIGSILATVSSRASHGIIKSASSLGVLRRVFLDADK